MHTLDLSSDVPKHATTYRDLIAWRKAFRLMTQVYALTHELPRDEQYCLSQQLRRAALSVPANIAEGYGRRSKNEYLYHLRTAVGSATEVEMLVHAAGALSYSTQARVEGLIALCVEVRAITNGLINALRKAPHR